MRAGLALLVLLISACTQPSTLVLESARPVPMRKPPERVLVVLMGALMPFPDREPPGAALQRELTACNLQVDTVVPPENAELSLEGDATARAVEQRVQSFRPDATLTITPVARTSPRGLIIDTSGMAFTYVMQVADMTTGKAAWRAAGRFEPRRGFNAAMPDLARLLTDELAKAAIINCPGRAA